MYYNSKNLKIDMERFRVLAYRQDGAIHIYETMVKLYSRFS